MLILLGLAMSCWGWYMLVLGRVYSCVLAQSAMTGLVLIGLHLTFRRGAW